MDGELAVSGASQHLCLYTYLLPLVVCCSFSDWLFVLDCSCNAYADSCYYNMFTGHGVCDNCTSYTAGDKCETCAQSFYVNPNGNPLAPYTPCTGQLYVFICVSLCLSVSFCLLASLFVCLFLFFQSPSVCHCSLSIYMPIFVFLSPSLYVLCLFISSCVLLSVCVCVWGLHVSLMVYFI